MKHYKIIPTLVVQREHHTHTTCDMCHGECGSDENYAIDECKINCKVGMNYQDGGHCDEIDVDLCSTCFKSKLVPWLKYQGVDVEEEEKYW